MYTMVSTPKVPKEEAGELIDEPATADCDAHTSIIPACKELSGEVTLARLSAELGGLPGLETLLAFEASTVKLPPTAAGKETDRPGQTQSTLQNTHDLFVTSKR